jgi:hypothetical protein
MTNMFRFVLVASVFAGLALSIGDASAGRRSRDGSDLHSLGDNPTGIPTPEEFIAQEWERRRAFGVCATLFECASGGRTGYTHLPYVREIERGPFWPPPDRRRR